MSANAPVLNGLNLIARDMKATLAFYRLLGMEIPENSVWGSGAGHHVKIDSTGSVDLELDSEGLAKAYNAAWRRPDGAGHTMIGFRVISLQAFDDTYTSLTNAGYSGLQEPCDAFWGSRCAIVEDPDGRNVSITSEAEDTYRSAPPEL